jgi:hypothetical protein
MGRAIGKADARRLKGPVADAVRFAEAHGYTLVQTRKHYLLKKQGFPSIYVPATSGDVRAGRNIQADVRRGRPRGAAPDQETA